MNGRANLIAGLALYAWPALTLVLFALLPARRAVLTSMIGGVLFLPTAYGIDLPGITYDKFAAAAIPSLLGAVAFDWKRFSRLRLCWVDLGMAAFVLGSIATTVRNGLGAYDGMVWAVWALLTWGAAYALGRVYFGDRDGLRILALAVFIGGLIYIPFCLWEMRMSPQLHKTVYGYHAAPFHTVWRFGGYRPAVFMQHGIMVGTWMTCAALAGLWLWRSGSVRNLWGASMWLLVGAQWVAAILCRSGNAFFMMAFGLGVFVFTRGVRSRLALAALLAGAPTYMALRGTGAWDGFPLLDIASSVLNQQRAKSLNGRLYHEGQLAELARQRPVLGWGAWGRNRVRDDYGNDQSVTDGMWIIYFGQRGFVGLGGFTVAMLGGAAVVAWRLRRKRLVEAEWAPAVAMVVIVGLVMIDNLFNAMVNPVYMMGAGGLVTLAMSKRAWREDPERKPRRARAGAAAGGNQYDPLQLEEHT